MLNMAVLYIDRGEAPNNCHYDRKAKTTLHSCRLKTGSLTMRRVYPLWTLDKYIGNYSEAKKFPAFDEN